MSVVIGCYTYHVYNCSHIIRKYMYVINEVIISKFCIAVKVFENIRYNRSMRENELFVVTCFFDKEFDKKKQIFEKKKFFFQKFYNKKDNFEVICYDVFFNFSVVGKCLYKRQLSFHYYKC